MRQHLNLLPAVSQRRLEVRSLVARSLVPFIVIILLCFLAYVKLDERRQDVLTELHRIEEQIAPLQRLDHANQTLLANSAKLQRESLERLALEQPNVPLAVLHLIGSCRVSAEQHFQLDTIRIDEVVSSGNNRSVKAAPETRKQLLLVGTAHDDSAISQLLMKLRSTKFISDVDLESSHATKQTDSSLRSFQIRCRL